MSMLIRKALLAKPPSTPITINDVFSAYAYTGSVAAQSIVNGVDLAGNGGMVWIKGRNTAFGHAVFDTTRGATNFLATNSIASSSPDAQSLTSFDSNGFTLGLGTPTYQTTGSPTYTYSSWTFRKAPKFFDIVTWNGNSVSGRAIPHSLGIKPGMMIVKQVAAAKDWYVWHKSLSSETANYLVLNSTAIVSSYPLWITAPDETNFYVSATSDVNGSGYTYVAYLFAHDTAADGLVKCGTYTGNGSSQTINAGFSAGASFILIKRTNAIGDWFIWDTTRGIVAGNDPHISPNITAVEVGADDSIDPHTSGFIVNQVTATNINFNTATYIYLAFA